MSHEIRRITSLSLTTRVALLPSLIAIALSSPAIAANSGGALVTVAAAEAAEPDQFDSGFFPTGDAPQIDISRFEKSGYVAPGTYHGDINVNQTWRARSDIVFAASSDQFDAEPCFKANDLTSFGIDLNKLDLDPAHLPSKAIPEGVFCGNLGDYIPGAATTFDSSEQVLNLSIPQIYMSRSARGYVDPSQWDPGMKAAALSYNANMYRVSNGGHDQSSGYVGLNASVHFYSWSLYHQGSATWTSGQGSHYQDTATYMQHDVPSIRAQVVVGETYTSGDLFDSVRLTGVRMYSDDRMLAQSLRGYAPVVQGVAETNAHVVIRQRGFIIYDTHVAPGPFKIDDLYPTGYGGDLSVEVTEADGRVKQFTVPFSSVAQSLRPGISRWSLAAGQISELHLLRRPMLVQGTYQRGISNSVTAYGGANLASGYRSVLVGAALDTKVGAFSADVTEAYSNENPGRSQKGASFRLGYNKNLVDTGTNFAVAAYRYSTKGFVSLEDAALLRDAYARGLDGSTLPFQRNRIDLTINQTLGRLGGQLYATGSRIDYWGVGGRQTNFTIGYSNHWRLLTYSLSAQRANVIASASTPAYLPNTIPGALATPSLLPAATSYRDTRFFLTLSLPLGRSPSAPMVTALVNHSDTQSGDSAQVSINGSAGENNRWNYGASLSRSSANNAINLNGQYTGSQGDVMASFSKGNGYQQEGVGASGGMVLSGKELTLSPPLGDTIGLVYAPGASGAHVQGTQGAVVDSNGYAVVPSLMPYQLNDVTLDPKGTDVGVELKDAASHVAPRANTIVLLRYETVSGRVLLVDTKLPDGRPIPFGAEVLDAQGNSIGAAGQASRLYLHGKLASGVVTVKWGDGPADACQIQLQLPTTTGPKAAGQLQTLRAPCGMPGTTSTQAGKGSLANPLAMLETARRNGCTEGALRLPAFRLPPQPNGSAGSAGAIG